MDTRCPKCNGEVIMEGKIYNQIDYINPAAYFRPTNSPFYAILNSNIRLPNAFLACSACGFVWAKLDDIGLHRLGAKRAY